MHGKRNLTRKTGIKKYLKYLIYGSECRFVTMKLNA